MLQFQAMGTTVTVDMPSLSHSEEEERAFVLALLSHSKLPVQLVGNIVNRLTIEGIHSDNGNLCATGFFYGGQVAIDAFAGGGIEYVSKV